MKTRLILIALALAVAVVRAEAKKKNKAFEGCVEYRQGQYELATSTPKGKVHRYVLIGDHNFAKDVGHQIRVNGVSENRRINVGAVHTVATQCR
jgi:hypothetical protein